MTDLAYQQPEYKRLRFHDLLATVVSPTLPMELKARRLTPHKKKRILALKAKGFAPKDIQKKLNIGKSTYYYFMSPTVAIKAKARSRIQRTKLSYRIQKNRWNAHKLKYQRWFRKKHHAQVRVWERRAKRKWRKAQKLKKIEDNKIKLIEIAKKLGLYETH